MTTVFVWLLLQVSMTGHVTLRGQFVEEAACRAEASDQAALRNAEGFHGSAAGVLCVAIPPPTKGKP